MVKLGFKHLSRVPDVVFQQSATECGLACVSMVSSYLGIYVSLEELRRYSELGRDGISLKGITDLLEDLQISYNVFNCEVADLFKDSNIGIYIAHWNFTHWIIIEGASSRGVRIVDPQSGRRWVSIEDFSRFFTGVVISFKKSKKRKTTNILSSIKISCERFWILCKEPVLANKRSIGLAILAAAIVQLIPAIVAAWTGFLFDRVPSGVSRNWLFFCIMTLIFFSIGVASSVASRGILSAQIGGRINYSIGEQAMKSLLRSRFSYLETRSAGDIVNRISSIQVIQILVSDEGYAKLLI